MALGSENSVPFGQNLDEESSINPSPTSASGLKRKRRKDNTRNNSNAVIFYERTQKIEKGRFSDELEPFMKRSDDGANTTDNKVHDFN